MLPKTEKSPHGQDNCIEYKTMDKMLYFFEGGHPVVYRHLFITLVPSIHNVCKDQMYYYGHPQANKEYSLLAWSLHTLCIDGTNILNKEMLYTETPTCHMKTWSTFTFKLHTALRYHTNVW